MERSDADNQSGDLINIHNSVCIIGEMKKELKSLKVKENHSHHNLQCHIMMLTNSNGRDLIGG